jgi:hypothetical protein
MKRILFIALIVSLAVFSACKKEYAVPSVTAPATQTIEVGISADLTFNYTAEAGFASSNLAATNGTAVIKTDGVAGSTSGTIVVTYTAARTSGAGSVNLTITDAESKTGMSTAVLDITSVPTISVTDNINEDTTWETGNIYILEGRITVLPSKTLTIEPGVVVKGRAGTGSNATALLVARGAKLMAEGTESAPIIFTSVSDMLLPGDIASPNLDPTLNGLWGGLLILGNAPISADAPSVGIEGIPPSDLNGLYGGSDPLDNSGSIRYISIRHGGANIGEGNEINGLTLGGVGSGTVIENIEVIANQDDGVEFFGGTVNVTNAVFWNIGDDAVDTDQSWAGTIDNFIIVNPGDECFELDGPEGAMEARHTIINGSVKAMDAEGLVDLDDNSIVTMNNIYFFGLKAGQDFDLKPAGLTVTDLEATLPDGALATDFFKDGSDAAVTTVAAGARSTGANVASFGNWTWTSVSGTLTDF